MYLIQISFRNANPIFVNGCYVLNLNIKFKFKLTFPLLTYVIYIMDVMHAMYVMYKI